MKGRGAGEGDVRAREQHLPAEGLGNTMYEVTVTSVGAVGLLRLVAVPDVADTCRQAGGGRHDGGGDHGDGGQTGNTCRKQSRSKSYITGM